MNQDLEDPGPFPVIVEGLGGPVMTRWHQEQLERAQAAADALRLTRSAVIRMAFDQGIGVIEEMARGTVPAESA
jgi:hypothetical protein